MKGVILAGGNGTRLLPLTKSVNKHLLPVGDRSMLQRCVERLTEAGILEIMVVTGGEHLGGIAEALGSGASFGCDFTFKVQDEAGGIAQALWLARNFVVGEPICVLLGDNIFEKPIIKAKENYEEKFRESNAPIAMVCLKEVPDPERFGVAVFGDDNRILSIEEKPKEPKSQMAVTGLYFYDDFVFDIISKLKPSDRGEMEITDVNNGYLETGLLEYTILDGWWTDAGTHESYRNANRLVGVE